jgi:membrane-associated phospholipid phosphatase
VPRTPRETAALWVSRVGHPFVLLPLTVGALMARRFGGRAGLLSGAAVAVATVLPVIALVVRGVRRSAYTDYDVSDRGQRKGFYRALFVVLPAGSAALWLLAPALRPGIVATWALILASMAANGVVKSSLHVGFAAYCAVLLPLTPWTAPLAGAAVAAIAWSRLALRRHTAREVACGAALGAAAGFGLRMWG